MTLEKKLMETFRGGQFRKYLTSTQFWGPVASWGIPIACYIDMHKDPKFISGTMTTAMLLFSSVYMRIAWKAHPRNMLLFICHFANGCVQSIQGGRYLAHYYGGRAEKEKNQVQG